ncbi:MAG: DUF2207 domain-containing protein, partial [Gammaproteobacteria bacterium]
MTLLLRLSLPIILTLAFSNISLARERILDYHSDISVQQDGSMLVEEQIKVVAEGNQIKRGIYRDFPTEYRDGLNNRYNVSFDLLEVKRDGVSEPYHTKSISNGIRVYAGRSDYVIPHGEHSYTFLYKTNHQLGFFKGFDELYWNVTGNGWDFPIDHASARVHLPGTIPPDEIRVEGYTGPRGSKAQNYTARVDYDGSALFETTTKLNRHEGLTIVTSWPKGYVSEPTDEQKMGRFLRDNSSAGIAIGGIALLLLYYLAAWRKVGRDPEPGAIIPLYQPDSGYSPASMRFISRMGYDNKSFSAAIVNMAVKGYLEIDESRTGVFTLRKT